MMCDVVFCMVKASGVHKGGALRKTREAFGASRLGQSEDGVFER